MYGQTLALAALSAAGALAAPQMCACPSNNGQLSVSAADASGTGSGYQAAPTTVIQTSTVTEHKTQTVTQMVNSQSSSLPVQTITETETQTITSTSTETTTVAGATNTPQAPVVNSGSIRPSNAPYYPTNGSGPSGVAQQTGSAGVAHSTGTAVSAAGASGSSRPAAYSYPHASGSSGFAHPSEHRTPSAPLGTGASASPFASGSSGFAHPSEHRTPYAPLGTGASVPYPHAYGSGSSGFAQPSEHRTQATPLGTAVSSSSVVATPSFGSYSLPVSVTPSAVPEASSSAAGPSGYETASQVSAEAVSSKPSSAAASATSSKASASATPSASASASKSDSPSATGQFPQAATVSNQACYENGAANKTTADNKGQPALTSYKCYSGPATNFPSGDKWVSYEDMKKVHAKLGQTWCANGILNTQDQTDAIFDAIDTIGAASHVDKRVILAQIVQESSGCVNVAPTNNGVNNPGLMQGHNGASFVGNSASKEEQAKNILQMVSDGVQGTYYKSGGGDGLVQTLDQYGDFFTAARAYNSGSVNKDNLSDAKGATASYCSDTANYLQGWNGDNRGTCSW